MKSFLLEPFNLHPLMSGGDYKERVNFKKAPKSVETSCQRRPVDENMKS